MHPLTPSHLQFQNAPHNRTSLRLIPPHIYHQAAYRSYVAAVLSEPSVQALATESLIKPAGKPEIDYLYHDHASALLWLGIFLASDPETMIGHLTIGQGGILATMAKNRSAARGLVLAKEHRGKGYGREALQWGVDWAFRHGNLHVLELWVYPFNEGAIKLYESMGFVCTGRRREVLYFDRKYHDELFYSITEEEWEERYKKAKEY